MHRSAPSVSPVRARIIVALAVLVLLLVVAVAAPAQAVQPQQATGPIIGVI